MVLEMTIHFPNHSRCHDPARQCVRFSGHDSVFEILFFVEDAALSRMSPDASNDEAGFLSVFDENRDRILEAAGKLYSGRHSAPYMIGAANLLS